MIKYSVHDNQNKIGKQEFTGQPIPFSIEKSILGCVNIQVRWFYFSSGQIWI